MSIPPAVAEFAVEEREQLLGRIAEQGREIARLNDGWRVANTQAFALGLELDAMKAQQPSGVVLPERKDPYEYSVGAPGWHVARAHNACLDEVARLNSSSVSDGEHSTQENYDHFLSYSGLADQPMLRYAYFHGADEHCEHPSSAAVADERAALEKRTHDILIRCLNHPHTFRHQIVSDDELCDVIEARAALTASAPNHSEQVRQMVEALEYIAAVYPYGNSHSVEAALVDVVKVASKALADSEGVKK